jgi:hypothetical protein
MTVQPDLLSWQPKGRTIDPARDTFRLKGQLAKVYAFMREVNGWTTLAAISAATGAPESSASARIRDLRGLGMTVERRYQARGLHVYRLVVNS